MKEWSQEYGKDKSFWVFAMISSGMGCEYTLKTICKSKRYRSLFFCDWLEHRLPSQSGNFQERYTAMAGGGFFYGINLVRFSSTVPLVVFIGNKLNIYMYAITLNGRDYLFICKWTPIKIYTNIGKERLYFLFRDFLIALIVRKQYFHILFSIYSINMIYALFT